MGGLDLLADGILVVNLDERADRWQEVLKELEPHVEGGRLQRLSAIKGVELEGFGRPPLFRGRMRDRTWAGRAGCVLSHREAITRAARAGWDRVLILEDDVRTAAELDRVCAALAGLLDTRQWDICYLGFTDPVGPFRKVSDLADGYSLHRIYGGSTTHAYLVRGTAYRPLLDLLPDRQDVWFWLTRHRAIDRWYARTLSRHFTVVAVSPSLINQRQGVSDITGRNQEYGHLIEIPSSASNLLPYPLAAGLRRIQFMFRYAVDSLRGIIKRKRGF